MQLALIAGVAAVVVVGLGAGWVISTPKDASGQPAPTSALAAPTVTPTTGDSSADGWKERRGLRDRLAAATAKLESDPCDDAARKDLAKAWTDRAKAQMSDAQERGQGNPPDFWRTADDQDLDKGVGRLVQEDIVGQDELSGALLADNPFASMQMRNSSWQPQQALVLVQRCGQAPRGDTAMRINQQHMEARLKAADQHFHSGAGHVYSGGR